MPVFIVSVILALAAIIGYFGLIPWIKDDLVRAFWCLAAGYAVLFIGNVFKGL